MLCMCFDLALRRSPLSVRLEARSRKLLGGGGPPRICWLLVAKSHPERRDARAVHTMRGARYFVQQHAVNRMRNGDQYARSYIADR